MRCLLLRLMVKLLVNLRLTVKHCDHLKFSLTQNLFFQLTIKISQFQRLRAKVIERQRFTPLRPSTSHVCRRSHVWAKIFILKYRIDKKNIISTSL